MPKRKKDSLKWIKETYELQPDHHWQSQPGYKVFVADRGAVRFDVPSHWIFEPRTGSFRFMDAEHPDNNCCLEVSFNRLPEHDWTLFPLKGILKKIIEQDTRNPIETGEVITVDRQTARIVWGQLKFIDPEEQREAYSRICVGIGSGIQCLITYEYWADQADSYVPVWDEVLRTLVLGLYIRDPMTGAAFPD